MPLYFALEQALFSSLLSRSEDQKAGGHVRFTGSVRAFNKKKAVSHLFYEAYEELAIKEFALLEETAKSRFGEIAIHAVHRLGLVNIGEDAVVIDVNAEHRDEAFRAARFMIDELKKKLPIWKEEHYQDGTAVWDQGCHCAFDNNEVLKPVKKTLLANQIEIEKLASARLLLIGAGGLGCPLALNIAALGVGRIDLYDGDKVEASNLARQYIFSLQDQGISKAARVSAFLAERYPSTAVAAHDEFMTREKAREIFAGFDLIIDGSDCLATKTMAAEEAKIAKVPFICASVFQDEGEVMLFHPEASGGCFSCFRRGIEDAPKCQTGGVFTHTCSYIAAFGTAQALNVLAGKNIAQNTLTLIDSLGVSKTLSIKSDPECLLCQKSSNFNPLRVLR